MRVTLCGTQSNFLVLLASCHAPTPGLGDERPLPITLCSRPDPGSVQVSHWEQPVRQEETVQTTLRSSQMSTLGTRRPSAGAASWARQKGQGHTQPLRQDPSPHALLGTRSQASTCVVLCPARGARRTCEEASSTAAPAPEAGLAASSAGTTPLPRGSWEGHVWACPVTHRNPPPGPGSCSA